MRHQRFDLQTSEGALLWMLKKKMIVRRSTKDPETFARVNGFTLSSAMSSQIGSNLVKLLGKAATSRNGSMSKITVRDAFLTATIGAVLAAGQTKLNEEEMMRCANIILALLPIDRLEKAGINRKRLKTLASDKHLVAKVLQVCSGPS